MPKRNTNLNQLRILSVLLKETNLSRAADILGISQPTLSSALKQLREEFNDPLLVRTGNRMELTAKAKSLEVPLNEIFRAVDTLWEQETADPKESRRHVLIGGTDYGAYMTAAPIFNRLAKYAPGILVQFVDTAETKDVINEETTFDFYIVPDMACQSPAFRDFKYMPLFDEEMVYMVGNHHPLAKAPNPSSDDINNESFVLYNIGMERYSTHSGRALANMGDNRKVAMQVQQFSMLPHIAENTDAVVILPRRMAESMLATHGCKMLGTTTPALKFSFCLMWDCVYQSDPVHAFLRDIFKSVFR